MSHFKIQCLVITEFYSKIVRVRRSFTLFPTEFYSFSDGKYFFYENGARPLSDLALLLFRLSNHNTLFKKS
jgi:hypothetical protein